MSTAQPRNVYSIRFPMTKERTGYRRGPRFRRVVDSTGLGGAPFCAARMINSAMLYRDAAPHARAELNKADRLGMRVSALWARVFAGQIENDDPRIEAAQRERHELITAVAGDFGGFRSIEERKTDAAEDVARITHAA
ncbi:MAG: hypothetical protein C0518_05460 [Opitutus sp.]|nr:hypothetical protein [Opitutus sp.]